jgi:hypothetical protein
MREGAGNLGENYEVVREINDKRHSDKKRWSCEVGWGMLLRGGVTVTPDVYISHHGANDVQRLADKTNPR